MRSPNVALPCEREKNRFVIAADVAGAGYAIMAVEITIARLQQVHF